MAEPRVVITGAGIVSPLGIGAARFRDALLAGESGIRPIAGFDPGPEPPRLGGEVGEVPARDWVPAAQLRRMDKLARMIGVAAALAAEEAGLRGSPDDELGVVVGSALGNLTESAQFLERLFTKGPSLANPMLFPNLVLNAPASQVAIALGWRGPNLTVTEGEISGEVALETAIALVLRGRARAALAAAGDELSPILFRALKDFRHVSPRRGAREWSSPFDAGANGAVLGEGAAAVVVESEDAARARGARAIAVVERCERFHVKSRAPHLWPAAEEAGIVEPLSIDPPEVVFSGADSSPERDRLELALIAAAAPGALVFSPKGSTGEHAASGLANVVIAALCVDAGRVPPLAALETVREGLAVRLPRRPEAIGGAALVLGTARGGAGVSIRIGRAVP